MTYSGIFFIRYRDSSGVFHEWSRMKLFGTTLVDLGITATAEELNAAAEIIGGDLNVSTLEAENAQVKSLQTNTISNPDNAVDISWLNITAKLTADENIVINFCGNTLKEVGDPVEEQDAVNKRYVDNLMGEVSALLDTINGEVI